MSNIYSRIRVTRPVISTGTVFFLKRFILCIDYTKKSTFAMSILSKYGLLNDGGIPIVGQYYTEMYIVQAIINNNPQLLERVLARKRLPIGPRPSIKVLTDMQPWMPHYEPMPLTPYLSVKADCRDARPTGYLQIASALGYADCLKVLLEAGLLQPDFTNDDGMTALHFAANSGSEDCVKYLLRMNADPNCIDCSGYSILHRLCTMDDDAHIACISRLLRTGAHANIIDDGPTGTTPAIVAALFDNEKALSLLMKYDADLKVVDLENRASLLVAASKKDSRCLPLLLKEAKDLDIEMCTSPFNNTALHLAVKLGLENNASLLLKAGANPNAENSYKETPLHVAVRSRQADTVQRLLRSGARPNAKNIYGSRPLHIAVGSSVISATYISGMEEYVSSDDVYASSAECLKHLLVAGADPNKKDGFKRTPIYILSTCSMPEHREHVCHLLAAGALLDDEQM